MRMIEDAGGDYLPGDTRSIKSNTGSTRVKHGQETGVEGLTMALSDWKVWWLALALTSMVVSLSFNAYFPTLSATMGNNATVTLLLCAPPWVFATIVALGVSK